MLCKICNTRQATYRGECKVCNYKKRNKDRIDAVLSCGNWSENELDIVIYHMLYEKHDVINEIIPYLNNKTLSDLAQLLEFDMPIRGKVKNQILLQCASCNESLIRPLKHFWRDRVYCNMECRDKYKTQYMSGENSPFYKRISTTCTNCGKPINVVPFDYNKINMYGENNNFCSQECYWGYRSKHYVGEHHSMYGYVYTEEQINRCRMDTINRISSGEFPHTLTRPHKQINNILDDNRIKYINEYPCKYYSIDIYLEEYNLMIEVMGDFWHGSPTKYNYDDLSNLQLKDIKQDKSKHTYIKKYHQIEILYVWENDIKQNLELCSRLIHLYIINNGVLPNYHSFNYHLKDSEIILNDTLISSYFDNTESLSTAG